MLNPSHVEKELFGVKVCPLCSLHAQLFAQYCSPKDFNYFSSHPLTYDITGWEDYIQSLNRSGSFAHALYLDEQLAGMSTVFDIDIANHRLEIGYTMIFSEFRGTQINPASKLIFMTEAFEKWGAKRVQLRANASNQFSNSAMKANGFQYEGILRNYGAVNELNEPYERSVSYYSVIDTEWKEIKAHLERRCAEKLKESATLC